MSQPYLQGPALIAACSSGRGAIVVVEGETFQDDAYFYGRWFALRALEVSFFPQNGWAKVVAAVADLRAQLPRRKVFGIIDRDFAPPSLLTQQAAIVPADGVYRTPLYTLENYLLDEHVWLAVIHMLTRGAPPAGWFTPAEVRARIDAAYQQCFDLVAFNRTVREEHDRLPGQGLDYKKHPKALLPPNMPEAELLAWGQGRSAPEPLDQRYRQHQAWIRALPPADWPVWITGKVVLKVFLEGFAPSLRSIPQELFKSIYIDQNPTAPADITTIVEAILQAP